MKRRLANLVVLLCLVLSLLWAAVWVRGYWVRDAFESVTYTPSANRRVHCIDWELVFVSGHLSLIYDDNYIPAPATMSPDEPTVVPSDRFTWEQGPPGWGSVRIQAINAIGFGYVINSASFFQVWLPSWFIQLLLTTPPAFVLIRRWLFRRKHQSGHCRTCGYDLRATPDRCPECGTAVTA